MKSWLDLSKRQRSAYIEEFEKKYPQKALKLNITGIVIGVICLFIGVAASEVNIFLMGVVAYLILLCASLIEQKKQEKEFVKWLAISKKVIK